jgi:hypothetical protein
VGCVNRWAGLIANQFFKNVVPVAGIVAAQMP